MMFLRLFIALVFIGFAYPVQAEVLDLLPTGVQWQAGNEEITYAEWSKQVRRPVACYYSVSPSSPAQCNWSQYQWDSNHQIRVGNNTLQCRRIAEPDTCSTNAYIPQAQRSQARCTVVRVHESPTLAIDQRLCATCSGSSCNFFIGTEIPVVDEPETSDVPPVTGQPVDNNPPITGPTQPRSNTGTGNGTGNGNGEAEPPPAVLENPLNSDSLEDLLLSFLRGIVRIAAIALLVFLVYVGFQFVAAQGNEEKLRTAKNAMLWTVIGGAILLGAEVIMGIIQSTANALSI